MLAAITDSGYRNIVLDRLAAQTRRIVGADQACVFVLDESDPRATIAAAGSGVPLELIGSRFGSDEGIIGHVLRTGDAILVSDYRRLVDPLALDAAGHHEGGSVPLRWGGRVRGVLSAGTSAGDGTFGYRQLELLGELADLAAAALEHGESRGPVDPIVHARVEALAAAMALRDGFTAHHSEEVVKVASAVGRAFDLEPAALIELEFAARLHDVGKIRVPDAILKKPFPLTDGEWRIMRRHAEWGAEALAEIPGLEVIATLVGLHHERWDGFGYPYGLRGDRIPLASRIIGTCDAFEAMTGGRPYRAPISVADALRELRACAGSHFDPEVVDALAENVPETFPVGDRVLAAA